MKGYKLFMFLFSNIPYFIFTVDRAQCIKITEQVRESADKLSKNVQRNNCMGKKNTKMKTTTNMTEVHEFRS